MDISICKICNAEKIYDAYHNLYERCSVCNNKHSPKYYLKNRKKIPERLKEQRQNNEEKTANMNKERNSKYKSKINALKDQIQLLTNRLNTIVVADEDVYASNATTK